MAAVISKKLLQISIKYAILTIQRRVILTALLNLAHREPRMRLILCPKSFSFALLCTRRIRHVKNSTAPITRRTISDPNIPSFTNMMGQTIMLEPTIVFAMDVMTLKELSQPLCWIREKRSSLILWSFKELGRCFSASTMPILISISAEFYSIIFDIPQIKSNNYQLCFIYLISQYYFNFMALQSGNKLAIYPKKSANSKDSIAPSENALNNQFLNENPFSEFAAQSQQLSNSPQNSRLKRETKKSTPKILKQPNRNENLSNRLAKDSDHIRAQRHENIDARTNNSPKQNKKQASNKKDPPMSPQRILSPRRAEHFKEELPIKNNNQQQINVPEQKKMQVLNAGMSKLSESIMDLKVSYQQLQQDQLKYSNDNYKARHQEKSINQNRVVSEKSKPEKEKDFKLFLQQYQKEKQARKKVIDHILQRDQQKLEQQLKDRQLKKQEEKKLRISQIKEYSKFESKHAQMKQLEQNSKKYVEEFVKKFKGNQSFVQKKQKLNEQNENKKKERQKEVLAERKEIFKPLKMEEIDQHRIWYENKREELDKDKRQIKQSQLDKIDEQNQNLQHFWKGNAHSIALQERLERRRKEKLPKEKVKKIKDYHEYIRQKFVPQTYQSRALEKSQLRNQSSLSHREVKRFRYYKGVSYGEIVQTTPIAKSQLEKRRIGDQYLEFMKKIPKKRSNSQQLKVKELSYQRPHNIRQQHYIQGKKVVKNSKILLSQDLKLEELNMVMLQLKANDQKWDKKQFVLSNQPYGRIQNYAGEQIALNEHLVQNIERKLSLLSQL